MKKKEIADEYPSYKVRATTNICIDIVYPTRKLCSSIHMMHGVYHLYLNVLVGLWVFKTNLIIFTSWSRATLFVEDI